jgi:signal transduction histidine kinase
MTFNYHRAFTVHTIQVESKRCNINEQMRRNSQRISETLYVTFLYLKTKCNSVTVPDKFSLSKFFLPKDIQLSRAEYKRLMLTGILAVLSASVAVIYAIVDLANNVFYSAPAYLLLFTSTSVSIVLIRHGRFKLAKVLLIISTNLVVFWAAINDPFETGVFIFFIPVGIGAFGMLGFEDIRTGLWLSAFTSLLFLLAFFSGIRIDNPPLTPAYIKISFVLNYFISLTISVLEVYFLIQLNKISEDELVRKEIFANQKNAELQKVNVELDRFVYSVSHDLRSPLSSIQGLINLAKLTQEPAEIMEILSMIEDRINSQDHFIREIIDYARNARTETIHQPVALKEVVAEVISSLRYSVNAELIRFDIRISDKIILHSDKTRLTVILSNLIGNAIKYHDLTRKDPYIEVAFDEEQSMIAISDNGSGISSEHVGRVFDMFYRAAENSKGSGLGLFITREAVTKLGGSIRLESEVGKGSSFFVHLPLAPAH